MTTKPLVLEYHNRLARQVSVARDARRLLITCLHEAEHWVGYAHARVLICSAYVDRRPGHMVYGCITPNDLSLFFDQSQAHEVDYIATMTGPQAEYLFTGKIDTGKASGGG